MTDTPMTPDVALTRLRQYGERTSTWSTATYNDGTEKALHQIAVSLASEVERLRLRPVEAHVLRNAASALEDDHPGAAAVVLEMANKAERAAAARPWASSAQQPSKSRVVLSDHDLSRVEFARTKHAELNGHSGDYAERLGSMSALAEILLEVIDRAEVGGTP
ncbi:hypothetical protein AB0B51_35095 [Streptomyces griseus]|uniref:hypothetical protein n=1 Tax=Streptomyces griseus TaxID=1911 RepID=UPI0004C5C871|nr:hypothetical protein [Streptomyces griseus]